MWERVSQAGKQEPGDARVGEAEGENIDGEVRETEGE